MQMEDPHFIPASAIDQPAVLSVWSALLPAGCKLLGASLFGDLFVARESGEVDMLDLVSGELKQVAVCVEEFEWDLTQPQRREELLMQSLADAALSAGLKPGAAECLAFRTPPMLGRSTAAGQPRPVGFRGVSQRVGEAVAADQGFTARHGSCRAPGRWAIPITRR